MAERRPSYVPTSSAGGTMSAYEPTYRENLAELLASAGRAFGLDNYQAGDIGRRATSLAEFSPLGALTSLDDAQRAGEAGNYGQAAIAAAGAIPMAGKGAKAAGELAEMRNATEGLFRQGVKPQVPQFDLPRYEPARGVPQRVQDVTSNPQVREGMLEAIERGKSMGGDEWYNLEPLRLNFADQFGNAEGTSRFNRFMDYFAGASPRSSVPENIRNASFYYGLDATGSPLPTPYVNEAGKTIKNPQPYGHLAQDLHRLNFEKIRSGQGLDQKANPKPLGFAENLKGNLTPVAVDTHAFRLPAILSQDPRFLEQSLQGGKGEPVRNIAKEFERGDVSMEDALQRPAFWATQPKENEYRAMEQFYQSLGREAGLDPGQAQASAWVGGGPVTGLQSDETKTAMDFFKDRVAVTAQKLKMDPRDVLARMMSGQMPLLSLGGAAAAGSLLRPEDQSGGHP